MKYKEHTLLNEDEMAHYLNIIKAFIEIDFSGITELREPLFILNIRYSENNLLKLKDFLFERNLEGLLKHDYDDDETISDHYAVLKFLNQDDKICHAIIYDDGFYSPGGDAPGVVEVYIQD